MGNQDFQPINDENNLGTLLFLDKPFIFPEKININ